MDKLVNHRIIFDKPHLKSFPSVRNESGFDPSFINFILANENLIFDRFISSNSKLPPPHFTVNQSNQLKELQGVVVQKQTCPRSQNHRQNGNKERNKKTQVGISENGGGSASNPNLPDHTMQKLTKRSIGYEFKRPFSCKRWLVTSIISRAHGIQASMVSRGDTGNRTSRLNKCKT